MKLTMLIKVTKVKVSVAMVAEMQIGSRPDMAKDNLLTRARFDKNYFTPKVSNL